MQDERSPLKELDAMRGVAAALSSLDAGGIGRVLRWAAEAFGSAPAPFAPTAVLPSAPKLSYEGRTTDSQVPTGSALTSFASIADLYAAAQPRSDADKALVVGYWIQILQGAQDFDSQSVNAELKHLGHGVGNITQAFGSLMTRKPQFVIQTRKTGTTQQARKRFKVTLAGQQAVERMIKAGASHADSSVE
jgi:hypothetical protein